MLDETAELFNFAFGTLSVKPKMDDFSGASIRSTFSGMIIAKIGKMIEMEMTPKVRTKVRTKFEEFLEKTQEANKNPGSEQKSLRATRP